MTGKPAGEREKGQITGKLKTCAQIRVEGVKALLPQGLSPQDRGAWRCEPCCHARQPPCEAR